MRVEDLLKYSGKNGDYYVKFLDRFKADEDFFSWNWMAFLFFPFWLLYRKLWKQFFVLLLLSTFITFVSFCIGSFYNNASSYIHINEFYYPILMLVSIFIVSIVSFPMFLSANSNYLKKAKKVIDKGEFKEGEGRSVKAVSVYVVFLIIFMAFNVWTFLEYEKRQNKLWMERFNSLSNSTVDAVGKDKSKFELLQKELNGFTYNAEWDKMKTTLEGYDNLTELSKVDYMFSVIKSLIVDEKIELLEMMTDSNLSIPKIKEVSGRDFVEYAYNEKKWKALKFLMTKGGFTFDKKILMKEDSYSGNRALQFAIKDKDIETVKWLIEKEISVKAKYYKGNSPLMFAVKADSLEMIKLLVKAGAKPNYRNLEGNSAIAYSQKSKSSEIKSYFETKISSDTFSTKMLNEAIKKEELALVKQIVASGIDVLESEKKQWGKTPLEVAVEAGNVKILDYLLNNGVDINQVWNEFGETSLSEMISHENAMELIKCALKHGADVNSATTAYNPLDRAFAPRGDWLDRARLLIEHNASLITPINRQNQLALHASLEHKDDALTNLIIDKMVKEGNSKFLSAEDENGDSPLTYAIWKKKLDIIKKLLKLGVNTKAMNNKKVQPISYANTKEMLELLEPYSDHKPSISDSYCMVYVENKFDKSKVSDCQKIAEYYESTKNHAQSIWYYYLANDLESIKRYSQDMSWIKDCDCNGYLAYMDIANAYLLSGDMEKAKKSYTTLAELSKYENNKEWMKYRFEVLEGLHTGYGVKAKKLWSDLWREKYKEEYFDKK